MSDGRRGELSDLVGRLAAGIHELRYRPAYDAAANICPVAFKAIPVFAWRRPHPWT